jgi:hypothetical protein
MTKVYDALREYVFDLEIVDTHEHVPGREAARDLRTDVLAEYLTHYFSCDLVSAGLRPEDLQAARDSAKPLAKRWRLVEPYWEAARNTGYGRSLDLAARDLYGFPRIDRRTIGPLAEAFAAARAAGGTYENVLKKRSRIRLSILDSGLDCDPRYFRSTVRLDDFVTVATRGGLADLARRAGVAGIHSLEDLEDACEKALAHDLARGAACLKSGLAYERTLRYPKVPRPAAEADFAAIFAEDSFTGPTRGYTGALADHMMHHVCRLADARGLAFQFHTGIQEGNGNWVRHTDPALLTDLFLEYPNVRFDCFHIGYPYQQTLAVLAKNFRNVFIDFSWAHIISPAASVAALVEYLDSVPANKISGFGGDYCFVDGIYGHQYMARENVARALALRVEAGACDVDEARRLATRILHDNPVAIFGLEGALKGGGAKSRPEAGAGRAKKRR